MPPKLRKPPTEPDAPSTQDQEKLDPTTLSKRMQQTRDNRKAEKRNLLQTKFEADMTEMEQNIQNLLEHAADESTTRGVNLTGRLAELFRARGEIEGLIICHLRVLEHAYAAANAEVREAVRGKLQDIEAGSKKEEVPEFEGEASA